MVDSRVPIDWNRERIAWIAGLLEGDGCFTVKQGRPMVIAGMSDLDVLQRLQAWTGLGTISGPHLPKNGMNKKPMWQWSVNSAPQSYALIVAVLPWLCERRQERALELVRIFNGAQPANRSKTHCLRGHLLEGDNLYVHAGRRKCRACRAIAQRDFRVRRKELSSA